MKVIGFDPGSNGAFSIVENGRLLCTETFPKVGGKLSFNLLVKRIQAKAHGVDFAVVERVQAIAGASSKSTFTFGRNFQMVLDAVSICNLQASLVKPLEWQNQVFKGETPIHKTTTKLKKRRDTKKMALVVAHRLFPDETFLSSDRASVPHDGLVDASLIAYYGAVLRGQV